MSKDNTIDNQLINAIKEKCGKNISFIDEVASILDINYDAAYRRVTNRTTISLADALKLTNHFDISINELYAFKGQDRFLVTNSKEINTELDLENYFNKLNKNINHLSVVQNSSILYCSKDLPLYYVLKNNLLSKFKLYVWLYILNTDKQTKYVSFEKFTLPVSLQIAAQKAGNAFKGVQINEIWNYGIINSIINQISYFYETKLLNYDNAIRICKDLTETIEKIERNVQFGQRLDNTKFKLYHNELLLLNNNILINSNNKLTLISPYSILKYYLIENQEVCRKFEKFIKTQISFSKLISNTNTKETILFFKPKKDKILKLIDRIELIRQFPLK